MSMESLNRQFGLPNAVAVAEGRNGLPKIQLKHRSGTRAEVYLHGAHVTSWTDTHGNELSFISRESFFQPEKPIRGGIPVIFPQFGGGALPPHGLARISEWTLLGSKSGPDGTALALGLESNAATRALWPHAFALELEVRLSESLGLRMTVKNTDDRPFTFQAALHTYFGVGDVVRASVEGLRNTAFVDSLQNNKREVETRDAVSFGQEVDRVYVAAPDSVRLVDGSNNRTILIEKTGMADVVVWNPWIEKAKRMPDFGDEEYPFMVCVETGQIAKPIELAPGKSWQGTTRFAVEQG